MTIGFKGEQDKLDVLLKFGNTQARIVDNVLTLEITTEDYQSAYNDACGVAELCLQHLVVSQGCLFKVMPTRIEGSTGVCPVPGRIYLGSLRRYNLDKLKADIAELQDYDDLSDKRLSRALEYFEHALFLFEVAQGLWFSSKGHSSLCMSEAFLYLWKTATSVLGDPSVRRDGYQRRCRELGLDDTQKKSFEQIRHLRNDHDVAHYSLSEESKKEVEDEFGDALATVARLVRHYREYLINSSNKDRTTNQTSQ